MPSPRIRRAKVWGVGAFVALLASGSAFAVLRGQAPSRSRTAMAQALPALDGRHLEATLLEVTYEPGGQNAAHRHPCPVIGYVLEGRLRMQVEGQAERVYEAGESFYESPADVHLVSANASPDRPARFLAYFVCDRKTRLSVPVAVPPPGGR